VRATHGSSARPQTAERLHYRSDRDLCLERGERGAEAEMRALREGEVSVVTTRNVELIGLMEPCRIAVG
jgi:hypothetical protein